MPAKVRGCYHCGKALSEHAGHCDLLRFPGGSLLSFCSIKCLHEWSEEEIGNYGDC